VLPERLRRKVNFKFYKIANLRLLHLGSSKLEWLSEKLDEIFSKNRLNI
jgi:hypothetical protein